MITYSTRSVHPRDRLSFWLEAVREIFFRHAFRSSNGSAFHGELCAGRVGPLKIAHCELDPGMASRSARDQARDDIDDILLGVRLAGHSVVGQDGRQAVHLPGSIVLLDTRRPGETAYAIKSTTIYAAIPRLALEARLGNLAPLVARPLSSDGPVASLAAGFLARLAERAGSLDEAVGPKLCEQALDLVALAFSSEMGLAGATLSSPRIAALMRLKSAIEARLHEPTLRPGAAAAAAGISVRYANALLSQEGYSVERYILHRRLERCRQMFEDRAQDNRLIGDIAFSWGFSDLSHFIRRFRAAYGMTPRDYRRRAGEQERAREDAPVAAAQPGGEHLKRRMAGRPATS